MLPWVLLPGTLCTHACFAPILSALQTLGIDPPTSTFVPGHRADPLEDATHLLTAVPDRFVVCGFSLGGVIAFQAALAAPQRIAAMILISVTGRADPTSNAPVRRAMVDRVRRESAALLVRDTLWPTYVAPSALEDGALRSTIEAMATATDPERFARQTEIAIVRPALEGVLASLPMPVLVISGAADVATPPDRGAEIADRLVDGQHAVIADAGHFVLMERPEATAVAIATWLAAHRGATLRHATVSCT